jgi:methyl-accepting chemotaxis protein
MTSTATAAREQAQGIQQISQAISELDNESQQNQQSMSFVSESADGLLAQSKTLDEIIYVLEKELKGGKASNPTDYT